jgi:hypothetical protein
MSNINSIFPQTPPDLIGKAGMPRKMYCKPDLVELGDLRTLTLGPSIGVSDSPADGAWNNGLGQSLPQTVQDKLNSLSTQDATPTPGLPTTYP